MQPAIPFFVKMWPAYETEFEAPGLDVYGSHPICMQFYLHFKKMIYSRLFLDCFYLPLK